MLGAEHDIYLKLRRTYASVLFRNHGASREDLEEAVTITEELVLTTRRVYGPTHPMTDSAQTGLRLARSQLASFETTANVLTLGVAGAVLFVLARALGIL